MPYALALVFFLLYAALSVSRQLQLRTTGYDLGIFEQAVRGYAHLGPPVAELKGPVKDRLRSYDLYDRIGDSQFFPTLGTAINGYLAATGTEWVDWSEAESDDTEP